MSGPTLYWLDARDDNQPFPDVSLALQEPNGLLAVGGNLAPQRLMHAYKSGVFPWYNDGQPILWWSPNPRAVLFPHQLHISRSLRKSLRSGVFTVSFDRAFAAVISACQAARPGASGTWITSEIKEAYCAMHHLGHAHSVECWQEGELVGGLYGLAFGQVFFGESMFSRVTNASKIAFAHAVIQLQTWGFKLIDCQVQSKHLQSLGAEDIDRGDFIELLRSYCDRPDHPLPWVFDHRFHE